MFGKKDWTERWRETVAYLDAVTPSQVGTHIESIVTVDAKRKSISQELSLGSRSDGKKDRGYDAQTAKRHALRALMLCQRVYYGGDTWAKCSDAFGNTETVGVNPTFANLSADWKNVSLNHWQTKSEDEIKNGIKMFDIVGGATAYDVQLAAFTERAEWNCAAGKP